MAQENKPDLVFLDLLLPGSQGWSVFETLRQDPETRNIKVVMLTGLVQGSVRRRALDMGADGYITKPFTPAELVGRMEALLAGA